MPDTFFLDRRSKELEDAFFLKQDQKLIEELRKMKAMEESISALREASSIQDEKILEKLVELDIHAEMVAALAAVPLIEVAWADGRVDPDEMEAILKAADGSGIHPGSHAHSILAQWLTHRPGPELMTAWIHYMEGLCSALSDEETDRLRKDLMERARKVAEASGGFLGLISSISPSERKILDRLENAFSGKSSATGG